MAVQSGGMFDGSLSRRSAAPHLLRLLLIVVLMFVLAPVSAPEVSTDASREIAAAGMSEPPRSTEGRYGPERRAVLHVFLAVGQSNMSGRGVPLSAAEDAVDPRIFQYGAKIRTFRSATVPLDMHDAATGISPASTFAREYLKTQPADVGVLIIPAAHGGTAFTMAAAALSWSVGGASAPEFDLAALAARQTLEGIAAARAAGHVVDMKGILWHQGENNSSMTTSRYSAELDELIAFFRSRLGAPNLPFVVGRMAPEGIAGTPGRVHVDRSHRETPSRVAYTGFAPSSVGGVNTGDRNHFSRMGVEYLGKTYLSAYRRAVANITARGSAGTG